MSSPIMSVSQNLDNIITLLFQLDVFHHSFMLTLRSKVVSLISCFILVCLEGVQLLPCLIECRSSSITSNNLWQIWQGQLLILLLEVFRNSCLDVFSLSKTYPNLMQNKTSIFVVLKLCRYFYFTLSATRNCDQLVEHICMREKSLNL